MIKVKFLDKYNKPEDNEFFYQEYENVEIGDIVAAETRYGYGLAVVSAIDQESEFTGIVKKVKTIVESNKEKREKELENIRLHNLIVEARRIYLIEQLEPYINREELVNMGAEWLEDAYKDIFDK